MSVLIEKLADVRLSMAVSIGLLEGDVLSMTVHIGKLKKLGKLLRDTSWSGSLAALSVGVFTSAEDARFSSA